MNWISDNCKKLILLGVIIVLMYFFKIIICYKKILKYSWVKDLLSGIYMWEKGG